MTRSQGRLGCPAENKFSVLNLFLCGCLQYCTGFCGRPCVAYNFEGPNSNTFKLYAGLGLVSFCLGCEFTVEYGGYAWNIMSPTVPVYLGMLLEIVGIVHYLFFWKPQNLMNQEESEISEGGGDSDSDLNSTVHVTESDNSLAASAGVSAVGLGLAAPVTSSAVAVVTVVGGPVAAYKSKTNSKSSSDLNDDESDCIYQGDDESECLLDQDLQTTPRGYDQGTANSEELSEGLEYVTEDLIDV